MAAEKSNEVMEEVCGAIENSAPSVLSTHGEDGGTEMTTFRGGVAGSNPAGGVANEEGSHDSTGGVANEEGSHDSTGGVANDNRLSVCITSSIQEPSVVFVVKDITDTDWGKSRYTCSLPQSTAITDLYSAIGKVSGYEKDSFLLAWCEDGTTDVTRATPLSPHSTQTLYELDMPSEPQRCHIILQDGPDAPPVKMSNHKDEGDSIRVANSVSTVPSSNALNNTTNNTWHTTHYLNKSDTGFVGLVNQAMTCYLNSLLQTLYMTPEFRKALYSWKYSGDISEGVKSIPYQLQRLFIHLQTSSKRAVETTDVTKSFGWDSSEAWQQHDVQELCRVMFDALEKRLRKDAHEHPELINELYQGDMKDYVKCLECDNESARKDHFLDIPLVIKPFGGTTAYSSVDEALDGFVDPETLNGDNQYFCDKCQKKCDAHKGLKFTKFPYLLTLQLKRFDFDYSTMHRIKLNDRMTFPFVLNLNKFIDSSDMPKHDDLDLNSLYKDFVIEKFEKRFTQHIMQSENSSSGQEVEESLSVAQMLKEGPYVYELFSIMIHSGSAIGGHYYAYIKSLSDTQWYSFNDQSVTRISHDDIEQTFGGADRSRGCYYSIYASSANAYMLMYRRIDVNKNASFPTKMDLPEHIRQQIKKEQHQEHMEKERQEWEKNLCKFRVFMRHPTTQEMVERKIEVHKDKTLRNATVEAYKALSLAGLMVPIDRCRLVRFDEYTETLDQSFEDTHQDMTFGSHVGGARSYYSFELFMEIRPVDVEFKVYNKGGLNLKVLVIDLPEETVRDPVQFRGEQGWKVSQLKEEIARHFNLDPSVMNLGLETYHNEGKHLPNSDHTLKNEGFYRKHTVFVCCDPEDYTKDYHNSIMNHVIDQYSNSITLYVTIPPPPPARPPLPPATPNTSVLHSDEDGLGDDSYSEDEHIVGGANKNGGVATDEGADVTTGGGGVATGEGADVTGGGGVATGGGGVATGEGADVTTGGGGGVATGEGDDVTTGGGGVTTGGGGVATDEGADVTTGGGGVATGEGADVTTGGGGVATDEGADVTTGGGGVTTGEGDDVTTGGGGVATGGGGMATGGGGVATGGGGVATGEGATGEGRVATEDLSKSGDMNDVNRPLQRTVIILIDRRKTLGDLKKHLEEMVVVPATEFKIYRVYSNNQEYEIFRLQDSLQSVPNETRMIVRLGRALLPGEFHIKLSLLRVNEVEFFKSVMDSIVSKEMTVRELKERLVKEAYEQGIEFPLKVERMRLRKKTWRSPGTVYLDHQIFEKDIHIFANYEMFIEPLEDEDSMKHPTQMQVYVRHWRPSTYTVDKTSEIILKENTPQHLKLKLSEFSGIPSDRIQFAKAYGSFPCEMSILDIESDLDWNPPVSTINSSPLAIYDDGAILYFKDSEEIVTELSSERKAELQKQENARLSKYNITTSSHSRYTQRHEKALKIWTDDDDDVTDPIQTASEG